MTAAAGRSRPNDRETRRSGAHLRGCDHGDHAPRPTCPSKPAATGVRHWRGSPRAFDQPLELIPARYSAIRARMAALHHVPLDWVPKTLANHKSNAKAALIWFAKEKDVLPHGVPLSPAWDRLRVQLTDPSTRYRLMPLMRFCSGVHIEPEAVDEAVIDRYMDHRARTTSPRQRCRKPANSGAAVECRHRQDRRLAAAASRRAAGEGRRRPRMGRLPGGPSRRHRRLFGWPHAHPPQQGRTAHPALQTIDHHNTAARARRRGQDGGEGGHPARQPDLVERADPSRMSPRKSSTATGARMGKFPRPIPSISAAGSLPSRMRSAGLMKMPSGGSKTSGSRSNSTAKTE